MPTAENALLQYEAGQTSYPMEALTNSGDNKTFDTNASLFSKANGYEPDVRPDGLATGGVVSVAASGSNDVVDISALTCYLAGVKTTVTASVDESITRAATDVACINSITVDSSGAIAVIKGTDSADTSFSETRGGAGGPPYIPVGSIEIAQVRMTSNTAAAILATEIFAVVGLHTERFDYPVFDEVAKDAQVVFASALPLIHTGDVTKGVYASYADPIFSDISIANDYVPSETAHSVNSVQVYGRTIGSTSKSLNQGSFTAYMNDGITDPLVKRKDDNLWFKFFPNKNKSAYILDQGILGVGRAFPAGDQMTAACTISAEEAATGVE